MIIGIASVVLPEKQSRINKNVNVKQTGEQIEATGGHDRFMFPC